MSTLSTVSSHGPWSSPKDPHHLKRRHTRGSTAHSHSSSRSACPSPSSSFLSLSENTFQHKNQPHRDEGLHQIDCLDSATASQPPPASRVKNSKHGGQEMDTDDLDKSSQSTSVPSWFGSLRSFAISASSSSRGAFAPLISSSSSPSRPNPSISSHSPSRGRSSSIYFAGNLDDNDSDSDYSIENYDEPITNKNGLKENRVRGPRMNWTMLDPSLGGIFSQSYKAVPGSDPELSSPSCSSSASSLHSPTLSNVEDLTVSEAHYRDEDSSEEEANNGGDEEAWPSRSKSSKNTVSENEPSSNAFASAYATPVSPSTASSALSFIKSYVPSLPNFNNESNPGSTGPQQQRTGTGVPSAPSSSVGGGFWSIRKLSMNMLSNNQYVSVDTPSSDDAFEDQPKTSGGDEPVIRQSYKDDEDDEGSFVTRAVPTLSLPPPPPVQASASYFSSILTSASSAVNSKGSQYISTQVRDNLEQFPVPVSSRSLKKIGRTD